MASSAWMLASPLGASVTACCSEGQPWSLGWTWGTARCGPAGVHLHGGSEAAACSSAVRSGQMWGPDWCRSAVAAAGHGQNCSCCCLACRWGLDAAATAYNGKETCLAVGQGMHSLSRTHCVAKLPQSERPPARNASAASMHQWQWQPVALPGPPCSMCVSCAVNSHQTGYWW